MKGTEDTFGEDSADLELYKAQNDFVREILLMEGHGGCLWVYRTLKRSFHIYKPVPALKEKGKRRLSYCRAGLINVAESNSMVIEIGLSPLAQDIYCSFVRSTD